MYGFDLSDVYELEFSCQTAPAPSFPPISSGFDLSDVYQTFCDLDPDPEPEPEGVEDDFERADGPVTAGAPWWTVQADSVEPLIEGGDLVLDEVGEDHIIYWTGDDFGADQYAEIDVALGSDPTQTGLIVRHDGVKSYYTLGWFYDNTDHLAKLMSGEMNFPVFAAHKELIHVLGAGERTLRLAAIGDEIIVYQNGSEQFRYTDATLTDGPPGLFLTGDHTSPVSAFRAGPAVEQDPRLFYVWEATTVDAATDPGVELGVRFTIDAPIVVYGARIWSRADTIVNDRFMKLWRNDTETQIALQQIPDKLSDANGGWVNCLFATPVELTDTGIEYTISANFVDYAYHGAALGSPVSAHGVTYLASGGRYKPSPGVFPSELFNNTFYFIDLLFT